MLRIESTVNYSRSSVYYQLYYKTINLSPIQKKIKLITVYLSPNRKQSTEYWPIWGNQKYLLEYPKSSKSLDENFKVQGIAVFF